MSEQAVYSGSCTHFASASVGHAVLITDPPYSDHVHDATASAIGSRPGTRKRDLGFSSLSAELREYIARAAASAARWSVIYTDIQGLHAWETAVARHVRSLPVLPGDVEGPDGTTADGETVLGALPWVRWSSPQMSGDRPPSGCEMLCLAHAAKKGKMRWGGPGNLVALVHKSLRGADKHTTEKPLDQALDLVAWFSEPGELVYDPTAGRGTIGVACALLGRDYLGCEVDGAESGKAEARINAARSGVLSDRDIERWKRWLRSVDLEDSLLPEADAVAETFKKGKIV